MTLSSKKNQQGATLVVVLLLLLIMMVLAISLSSNSSTHTQIANKSVLKAQAFQAAENGSDIVLNYLKDTNSSALADLKDRTCDKQFSEQYTAASHNIMKTSSDDVKRKIKSAWYACYPKDQKDLSCGSGTCFAIIIAGVACPDDGAPNGITITEACVVSRHLQGYQINN